MKLDDIVVRAAELHGAPLDTRLQWLEDAALAVERAHADLHDDGVVASQHLRAALGAIVVWSQGPKEDASLVELEALVRTLIARALVALVRGLAAKWDAIARVDGAPHRAEARLVAEAYDEIGRALQRGDAPPESALAKLRAVGAQLEGLGDLST